MFYCKHEKHPVEMVQISARRYVVRECGWDVRISTKDRASDMYRALVAKHDLMEQRFHNAYEGN